MEARHPHLIMLAGPNGSGKSTAAPTLLKGRLKVREFVNADLIAQGISGFAPENAAFEAGRVMLRRIHDLAERREDFAFETTLASRSFARGVRNFLQIYQPLTTNWKVFDNSSRVPTLIASGGRSRRERVIDPRTWSRIQQQTHDHS